EESFELLQDLHKYVINNDKPHFYQYGIVEAYDNYTEEQKKAIIESIKDVEPWDWEYNSLVEIFLQQNVNFAMDYAIANNHPKLFQDAKWDLLVETGLKDQKLLDKLTGHFLKENPVFYRMFAFDLGLSSKKMKQVKC